MHRAARRGGGHAHALHHQVHRSGGRGQVNGAGLARLVDEDRQAVGHGHVSGQRGIQQQGVAAGGRGRQFHVAQGRHLHLAAIRVDQAGVGAVVVAVLAQHGVVAIAARQQIPEIDEHAVAGLDVEAVGHHLAAGLDAALDHRAAGQRRGAVAVEQAERVGAADKVAAGQRDGVGACGQGQHAHVG